MKDSDLTIPSPAQIKRVLKTDIKNLPSFPQVIHKLMAVCSNENASVQTLAKIIETDPGISAKILSLSNSALHGLRQKVSTISDAVIFLGLDEVKRLSLGVTIYENLFKSPRKKGFDRVFFWRHCLCVATLSLAIAEHIHYPNPGEAYISGLLHDFGKILLDLQGRVKYSAFITNCPKSSGRLINEEREVMGMGHDDLGAFYAAHWQLPDSILLSVKYHHRRFASLNLPTPQATLISIIALANFLAWSQGMGAVDVIRLPVLQPEVEKYINLTEIDFTKIIHRMDKELTDTSKFYHFVFPSTNRLRENLLKANLNLSKINTVFYYPTTISQENIDILQIKESITTPHRSLEPKTIISTTLEAICKDFKFDRVYVMKVMKARRSLQVIDFVDHSHIEMNYQSIDIPLDKGNGGFIHCLRNQEPTIIKGNTVSEKKVLMQFKISEMIIVPFCSHNKVLGVLGMDHVISKKTISPDLLFPITIVAHELGKAMENACAYKEARAVSLKDGLTGLLNRPAIDALLAKAFNKATAGENDLAVVMIDVDHFKRFNDNFGHQAGDNVLKLIAATLKKISRPFDHAARYGGEEFIVVLNNTDLKNAIVYAERIRAEIQRLGHLLRHRFPGLSLTVSSGVSHYRKGVKTQDQLIAMADKALYRAKETGRNKVVSA